MAEEKQTIEKTATDSARKALSPEASAQESLSARRGKRARRAVLVLLLLVLTFAALYLLDLLLHPKYMGEVTEGALTAEYYEAYG
ncbi:MAG: hypothetical protein IKX04_06990, partial [Clostridiales bacterium]|nr:hypothetical protein [Clostridiales bacterium]